MTTEDKTFAAPTGSEFKVNIYPVIYWALAYGLVAAIVLLLLKVLSDNITGLWAIVFVAGLVWGGYRNYQIQKKAWVGQGHAAAPQSPVEEFKQAIKDIAGASRDLMKQTAAQAEKVVPTENVAPNIDSAAPTAPAAAPAAPAAPDQPDSNERIETITPTGK